MSLLEIVFGGVGCGLVGRALSSVDRAWHPPCTYHCRGNTADTLRSIVQSLLSASVNHGHIFQFLIWFRLTWLFSPLAGAEAVEWISKAFSDDSALLKHELAYCLGQMQDRRAIPVLIDVLKDRSQEPMVRHEAGKARTTTRISSQKEPVFFHRDHHSLLASYRD